MVFTPPFQIRHGCLSSPQFKMVSGHSGEDISHINFGCGVLDKCQVHCVIKDLKNLETDMKIVFNYLFIFIPKSLH